MPELPEVETIRIQIEPIVTGQTVDNTVIKWERSIRGNPTLFKQMVAGQTIISLGRRGKYLCFRFQSGLLMTLHLGMTGKLMTKLKGRDQHYVRVCFEFESGLSLYFIDIRKLGKIRIWPDSDALLPGLGPEPLSTENVTKALRLTNTSRSIKTVLLDQHFLAGIGNIYADEILFRSGIHPVIPFNRVPQSKMTTLSRVIPDILQKAIEKFGTTIRNYHPPDTSQGENQLYLQVYGRTGRACNICGTQIEKIKINNRSSHFCPHCQLQ